MPRPDCASPSHGKNVLQLGLAFWGLRKVSSLALRRTPTGALQPRHRDVDAPLADEAIRGATGVVATSSCIFRDDDGQVSSSSSSSVPGISGRGNLIYTSDGVTVEERLHALYQHVGRSGGSGGSGSSRRGLRGGAMGGGGGRGGKGSAAGGSGGSENIPHPSPSAYPFWPLADLLEEPYSSVVAWRGRDREGRALLHVKLGDAVEFLSPAEKQKMEPVVVSLCFHGIGALCLAREKTSKTPTRARNPQTLKPNA